MYRVNLFMSEFGSRRSIHQVIPPVDSGQLFCETCSSLVLVVLKYGAHLNIVHPCCIKESGEFFCPNLIIIILLRISFPGLS
jgi:hypothetical protein